MPLSLPKERKHLNNSALMNIVSQVTVSLRYISYYHYQQYPP